MIRISGGICTFVFLSVSYFASAQSPTYHVEFEDKDTILFSLKQPEKFLSKQALLRRAKQNIKVIWEDIPVNPYYIKTLNKTGAKVLFTSRWFNSAEVELADTSLAYKLDSLPFVISHKRLRKKGGFKVKTNEEQNLLITADYGDSYNQIHLHKGEYLHKLGYTGEGKIIAVIDAGFTGVKDLKAFEDLRQHNRIIDSHDFVLEGKGIYDAATHGMFVLSTIAGKIPGKLLGTSPQASFILLRTESEKNETVVEEDAWVAAAEFADSCGADIITTSLGYSDFTDTLLKQTLSHKYTDLNGKTSRASIAATLAVHKGIIVINSAGNEGNKPWHYISVPADAEDILTVGAVTSNGSITSFSSRGPTSDGRIKPDVCAMGSWVICASQTDGDIQGVSGTSVAAPIIAGLSACLWQAFPDKSSIEIMNAIRQSSHQYFNPDNNYGYGIPDFSLAYQSLKNKKLYTGEDYLVQIFPNPFSNEISLTYFKNNHENKVELNLYDITGRCVFQKIFVSQASDFQQKEIIEISKELSPGFYLAEVKIGKRFFKTKILKAANI